MLQVRAALRSGMVDVMHKRGAGGTWKSTWKSALWNVDKDVGHEETSGGCLTALQPARR
jgi:hypothetical protein